MREIEFRGKCPTTDRWFYGDLHQINEPFLVTWIIDKEVNKQLVDPETVGQWTGLVDTNGKRIYELDIVRVTGSEDFGVDMLDIDELCIIKYGRASDSYKAPEFYCDVIKKRRVGVTENGTYDLNTFGLFEAEPRDEYELDFEVIGNIHDNPELLGKKGKA